MNLLSNFFKFLPEHWPISLKEFVAKCRSLAFPLEQAKLEQIVSDSCVAPLYPVLSQGMNPKKKHEVEVLAAVINSVARSVDSHTIVDVGSGQGYLTQVLSFQYKLSVLAIDGSLHHGEVTKSRAVRINKHYAANMRKLGSERWSLTMPKTITCCVLSASMLRNLSSEVEVEEQKLCGKYSEAFCLGGDNGKMNFTKDVTSAEVLAKYFPKVLSATPSIGRQGKALRHQQQRNTRNTDSDCEERMAESDKYNLFKSFSQSGLCHLGLGPLENLELHGVWKESEPFTELIGTYWSLRAALGPVLETLLLLDRLIFLQEQGSLLNVDMLPMFDPVITPRNVAIIARKS